MPSLSSSRSLIYYVPLVQRRLLFDAGPTEDLWTRNAEKMGIPLQDIDAVVLSHWCAHMFFRADVIWRSIGQSAFNGLLNSFGRISGGDLCILLPECVTKECSSVSEHGGPP